MGAQEAALAYADAGWFVLPVRSMTKNPGSIVGGGWQTLSSRDPRQIRTWFGSGSELDVALHVGRSGAIAFDVDHPEALPPILRLAIERAEPPQQSTRSGASARGHYLFALPAGIEFGNGWGALPKGWGEVRGRNGVIMVQPSRHQAVGEGGRYEWELVGVVPELPPELVNALSGKTGAGGVRDVPPASTAQVEAFFAAHNTGSRPELIEGWKRLFQQEISAGASRHQAMLSKAAGAMEEAAAGLLDARIVAHELSGVFVDAVTKPSQSPEQGAARTEATARDEWESILAWAVAQATVKDSATVPPISLDDAHSVFLRWLGVDYDLEVLDTVLAVAAVEKLGGDPAWLLVISGSGAAKTETVAALAAAGAHLTSTIASEGALLSGTAQKERSKSATGGLLRKIGDRGVLVIKDVTSVLSMNRDARASVLAALREIYDGRWERNLGSDGGQSLTWTGRLVVIGAVTTAWDKAHEVIATMGDRFVLIRLDSTQGRQASGRQAIANTGNEVQMRSELGVAVAGVLAGIDTECDLDMSDEEKALILSLADIVTLARTAVQHDYRGDVVDAHAPEMPTRFAKQLTQIIRGGIVLDIPRDRALRIVTRCAADSIPPLRLAVLWDLACHPVSTTSDVRKRINKPRATVDRTLQALHMLGLLDLQEEARQNNQTRWFYSVADVVDVDALVGMRLSQKRQK